MYNTGMVQVEEKLLEKYNDFELLLKEKFNNEINSVTDYVERMAFIRRMQQNTFLIGKKQLLFWCLLLTK